MNEKLEFLGLLFAKQDAAMPIYDIFINDVINRGMIKNVIGYLNTPVIWLKPYYNE